MNYKLSNAQGREIKDSVRSWMGRRIPTELGRIMGKYGIDWGINGGGHYEFFLNNRKINYSCISGDWRAGRNLGKKLIDFIEQNYQEKIEK